MKAKTPARCIHGRHDCPRCRSFTRSLIVAVEARDSQWKTGVLATLNTRSPGRTVAAASNP